MTVAFLLTSLVIVVTPGTGALYTISTGISRGRRASMYAAVGCTLGIVPHLVAAMTGTAALIRTSGVAFETLKLLGVAYLVYMAISTWRDHRPLRIDTHERPRSPARIVTSAVLVNLLNPKLTLFFFAFLPQFVPAHQGQQVGPMLLLSSIFMAMTLVVFVVYGAAAARIRRHLIDRPRVMRNLRRAFAGTFLGLGAALVTTDR